MPLVDHSGRTVHLGSELGRGGEGIVYEIPAAPAHVAKVYLNRPSAQRAAKFSWMVRNSASDLESACAWPTATLHESMSGPITGIVMPRIPGYYLDVHLLYGLRSRVQKFPTANWDFLVHAAWNAAVVFERIHARGHLVGDVNERNLLVSTRDATVRIIDCDSFQVRAGSQLFVCEVGVPLYTPPELQGAALGERTNVHDLFGLAVLIFQLLFVGRHPFAGKSLAPGDITPEEAIKGFKFAFSRRAQALRMQPPPLSPTLDMLPPSLGDLFETAFSPQGQVGRPTATEWKQGLEQLRRGLRNCVAQTSHRFSSHLTSCPWCQIASSSQFRFDYFINATTMATFAIAANDLDALLQDLLKLSPPPLPTLLSRPVPPLRAAVPGQTPKSRSIQRRVRPLIVASVCAATVAGLGVALGARLPGFVLGTPATLCFVVLILTLVYRSRFSMEGRKAARLRAIQRTLGERRAGTLAVGTDKIDDYTSSYQNARSRFDKARQEYAALKSRYDAEWQRLIDDRERWQRRQFLEQFSIGREDIAKVGAGRKATLRGEGIETAYDVLYEQWNVSGFGPKLRSNLVQWARQKEAGFRFDPQKGVPDSEKRLLAYQYRQRQVASRSTAEQIVNDLRDARSALDKTMEGIALRLRDEDENANEADKAYRDAADKIDLGVWPLWAGRPFWRGIGATWIAILIMAAIANAPASRASHRTESVQVVPEQIVVTIVALPENATILIDGQAQSSHVVLPQSENMHQLTVLAPGFTPHRESFVGNRDATLSVSLVRSQLPIAKHLVPATEAAVAGAAHRERSIGSHPSASGELPAEAPTDEEKTSDDETTDEDTEEERPTPPSSLRAKKWVDPFEVQHEQEPKAKEKPWVDPFSE